MFNIFIFFNISNLNSKLVGRKSTTRPPDNLDLSLSSKDNKSTGDLLDDIIICFPWLIRSLKV